MEDLSRNKLIFFQGKLQCIKDYYFKNNLIGSI